MSGSWTPRTTAHYAADLANRDWATAPASADTPHRLLAEATADQALVGKLWQQHPNANVGLALGRKFHKWALAVLGAAGQRVLAAWEARHGRLIAPSVRHDETVWYIFLLPPDLALATALGLESGAVNVLSDDASILLPPSRDRAGCAYEWLRSPNHVPLAAAPPWLLAKVQTELSQERTATGCGRADQPGVAVHATVATAVPADDATSAAAEAPPTTPERIVEPSTTTAPAACRVPAKREPAPDDPSSGSDDGNAFGSVVASGAMETELAVDSHDGRAVAATVPMAVVAGDTAAADEQHAEPTNTSPPADDSGNDAAVGSSGAAQPRLREVPIASIQLGRRHRQEVGDLTDLNASIRKVGLLHPPVVTPDLRLVVGGRRVAVLQQLGRTTTPVVVIDNLEDAVLLLEAERDENTCRQPLRPSEMVELTRTLATLEKQRAKERQRHHGGTAPGRPKNTRGKLPPVSPNGKTRDVLAAAVGISGRTLDMARTVVAAGENDPARHAKTVEEMDRTGNVSAAYQKVKGGRPQPRAKEERPPAAARPRRVAGSVAETFVITKPVAADDVTSLADGIVDFLGLELTNQLTNELRQAVDRHLATKRSKGARKPSSKHRGPNMTPPRRPRQATASKSNRPAKRTKGGSRVKRNQASSTALFD